MQHNHFHEARLKVERAIDHINEVGEQFAVFTQSDFYRLRSEYDTQVRAYALSLDVAHIPIGIALAIGDAVHNLRAALDYVASAVAAKDGIPDKRTTFPKHGTRTQLVTELSRKGGFEEKAGTAITEIIRDQIRPYPTDDGNKPLWALMELDNIDKHRLIVPTLGVTRLESFKIESVNKVRFEGRSSVTLHGGGSAPFFFNAYPMEIKDNGNPAFDILFRNIEVFCGEAIIPTLEQGVELVLGVIKTIEEVFFG